ncbi:tyrosine-type recombinase/integrase [Devosia sp. WQ 349]|nr:tyrosine-type recombinase/integrase [Devosia sp. WQ 349K1]
MSRLPTNVTEFKDRHGNWHVRFRAKGRATYYFQHKPGTVEFEAELAACRSGVAAPKIASKTMRATPGSMNALISIYYASPEFLGLKASTKAGYKGVLDRFRAIYGEALVTDFKRQSIKEILGTMADRPSAANHLLDRLKAIFGLAIDLEWRGDDPTISVKGYKIDGDGFHTWTEDQITQYEQAHGPGTKARRALYIALYAGQRRSDAVQMGKQNRRGNRIDVRQEKTGAYLSIPLHPALAAELDAAPEGDLLYLMTEYGKPHSAKAFGNWFQKRVQEASLDGCTYHGLRKAAARRLAEAGCTNQQIKAITGHKTDREVSRYTAAADQITLSDQALVKLQQSKGRT